MPGVTVDRLALRKSERGLAVGASGSGKSVLAEHLGYAFLRRYPRNGRWIIVDTKPRFRGELLANGSSASRLYRKWDHGATVPGSTVARDLDELRLAVTTGGQTIILQSEDVPEQTRMLGRLFDELRASRPALATIDELLDFYNANGSALRGTQGSILRWVRAGREKGGSILACTQRSRGVPPQIVSEITRLYQFRMDYAEDNRQLRFAGAPVDQLDATRPETDHHFAYWTRLDRSRVWGPYKLHLP